MPKSKSPEISFEQALQQLDTIVKSLESGQLPLDKAIEEYEKSVSLIRHCEKILTDCEKRMTVLKLNKEGNLEENDFNPPE